MTKPVPKTDREFIAAMRRDADPAMSEVEHLLKLIRDGDLIHVDEVRDWLARQEDAA